MQKQLFHDDFNSGGNDVWLNPLFKFLRGFNPDIAMYDLNGDSGTSDGTDFYDRVTQIEKSPTMHSFHIDLPGGSYLIGSHGHILVDDLKIPVVIYGIGSPLASAESVIIIQAKDRNAFEDLYHFNKPLV